MNLSLGLTANCTVPNEPSVTFVMTPLLILAKSASLSAIEPSPLMEEVPLVQGAPYCYTVPTR